MLLAESICAHSALNVLAAPADTLSSFASVYGTCSVAFSVIRIW